MENLSLTCPIYMLAPGPLRPQAVKPPLIGEVAQRAGEVEFPRGDLKTTSQGSKKRRCRMKTTPF